MALTTVANVKEHCGIPAADTTEDNFLTPLVDQVLDALATRFNRAIESATFTEYYDGDGDEVDRILQLDNRPVTAVTSVHIDSKAYYGQGTDPYPAASLITEGVDFAVPRKDESEKNAGQLVKIRGIWKAGLGNIKVVYVAGYTTVPPQLELVANQLCALVRNSAEYGGLVEAGTVGKEAFKLLGKAAEGQGGQWAVEAHGIIGHFRRIAI